MIFDLTIISLHLNDTTHMYCLSVFCCHVSLHCYTHQLSKLKSKYCYPCPHVDIIRTNLSFLLWLGIGVVYNVEIDKLNSCKVLYHTLYWDKMIVLICGKWPRYVYNVPAFFCVINPIWSDVMAEFSITSSYTF